MAYTVSEEWREKCYSGESIYDCRLYIGETLVPSEQIANIKISSPIVDTTKDNSNSFYVGSFISQKITIKFNNLSDLDQEIVSNIKSGNDVSLYIGQYTDDVEPHTTYEEIPIGKYIIDELGENYYKNWELVCLDYGIKFAQNLDYSGALHDGSIKVDELLEWICDYYGVTLGSYPTTNGDVLVGSYDNTQSGKYYISCIAEIKGCNAKIDRNGALNLIPIKTPPVVTIDATEGAEWELGEKYEVSKVTYYDAVRNYTFGDDSENTLFIRQDNPFVVDENVVLNIYNSICGEEVTTTTSGTEFSLDDTVSSPIELELKPNTSQFTTTGKNICQVNLTQTITQNGITFTPMGDGGIKVSGTATNLSVLRISTPISLTSGTTYYINGGYSANVRVDFRDSNNTSYGTPSEGATSEGSFTPSSTMANMQVSIRVANGTTISGSPILYPMLSTTSGTNYEPYTNGASPNPSYPQDVNVVSGDNNVVVEGENMFDLTTWNDVQTSLSQNGNYAEYTDNSVIIHNVSGGDVHLANGVVGSGGTVGANYTKYLIPCEPNTTYTVSFDKTSSDFSSSNNDSSYLDVLDVTRKAIDFQQLIGDFSTRVYKIITTGANAKYLLFRFGVRQSVGTITYSNIILTRGTNTSFRPYQSQEYKIDLPSGNLFNKNTTPIFNGYIDSSTSKIVGNANNRILYIPIRENTTYTIKKAIGNTPRFRMMLTDVIPTSNLGGYNYDANDNVDTMTIANTTHKYLCVWYWTSASSTPESDIKNSIVIYKGAIQPETLEYCSIGDYKDRFLKTSGKNLFNGIYQNAIVGADGKYNESDNTRTAMVEIEPNTTYCIKKFMNTGLGNRLCIVESSTELSSGQAGTPIYYSESVNEYSYTSGASAKYLYVYVSNNTSNIPNLMVSKGSTMPSIYEPYGTNEWWIEKKIGKVSLDGSETWVDNQDKTYVKQYVKYTLSDNIATGTSNIASDFFKYKQGDPTNTTNEDYMWVYQKHLVVDVRKTIVANKEELKSWVATNKPTFYFQLATPTYTKIEGELADQLEDIYNNVHTFEGQTNISQVNNDLPFNIDINSYFTQDRFLIYSLKHRNYGDLSLDAWDIVNYDVDGTSYPTLNDNTTTYEMTVMSDVQVSIPTAQQEATTNVIGGTQSQKIKRVSTTVDNLQGQITLNANEIDDLQANVGSLQITSDTINSTVSSMQTDMSTMQTSINQKADNVTFEVYKDKVDNIEENGVTKVNSTMVKIDETGLSVATSTSKITTTMTNNEFRVVANDDPTNPTKLAFIGYDENEHTSKSEMDNLTVKQYFVAGVHRTEALDLTDPATGNTEKRTSVFYTG